MEVKTHTFNGRKYTVWVGQELDGMCDCFGMDERYIVSMAKAGSRKELITIIHEALHACDWCKSEEVIDRVSTEIGSFLWRLGYRR